MAQGETVAEAVSNAEQGVRHIEHNVETELFDECPQCGSKEIDNVRGNIEEPLQFCCRHCREQFHYFEARSVELFDRAG
jgi:transposase-like protein